MTINCSQNSYETINSTIVCEIHIFSYISHAKVFLSQTQDIALLSSESKIFTFLHSEAMLCSFPSELTKAYLVGEKVSSIYQFIG